MRLSVFQLGRVDFHVKVLVLLLLDIRSNACIHCAHGMKGVAV